MFLSARLKVERAKQHVINLHGLMQHFLTTAYYSAVIEHDPETSRHVVKVRGTAQAPFQFALVIGDAIHNLRSSLDHVASAVTDRNSTTIYFPFHKDPKNFASCGNVRAINKAYPGLGEHIVAKLEPFDGGRHALWPITKLDAIDKHKLIIAVVAATRLRFERIIDKEYGNSIENCTVIIREGGVFNLAVFGGKPEFEGDIEPSFDIFFPQGAFFEGRPIYPTLVNLCQAVAEAVDTVAEFVRNAGRVADGNQEERSVGRG